MTTDIEKIVPKLVQLNRDINEAYSAFRFFWDNEKESEKYGKKYHGLMREKELLLKPIFGL